MEHRTTASLSASLPALRRHRRTAIVAVIGAVAGAAYAHFFGCNGSCPITSSVWTSALYGAGVGALVGWPARAGGPRTRAGEEEPS
jgi:hypothetical protein